MHESEGVIKYQLHFETAELPSFVFLAEINAWRTIFLKLALIGQDDDRYEGLGFGNISRRIAPGSPEFIITGTQTGHLQSLESGDYARVTEAHAETNTLFAQGETKPSSEALTHAGLYQLHPGINAVIHVHSPDIWRNTQALHLPHTPPHIAYGTPEMADAVARLYVCENWQKTGFFSLLGHEDGVIAFGSTLAEAATQMIEVLARALSIAEKPLALEGERLG